MIEKISLPTISGLMLPQSIKIVRLFVECNNWAEVKAKAVETNVMQIDKLASSSRYISYIIKNLKNLTLEEIQFFDGAGIEDQRTLLWIAFCRTFPIVGLFASEVVHQKFLSYEKTLSFSDWNEFLSRKANENDSIDNIGKETRKKAKSVIFTNLHQAGFLSSSNELKAADISEDAKKIIGKDIVFLPILSIGGAK